MTGREKESGQNPERGPDSCENFMKLIKKKRSEQTNGSRNGLRGENTVGTC